MAGFSIQDAAFTGFEVVRKHPQAVAAWSVYQLVLSLAVGLITIGLLGPDLAQLQATNGQPPKDPAVLMATFGRLLPGYLVLIPVILASNAVMGAAMIRVVLTPDDSRFGFLRLGADELRQAGLGLLAFVVFIGLYLGAALVIGLAAGLGFVAGQAAGTIVAGALICAGIGAFMVAAVRLSMAPALTFERRRIDLFGSWAITRGYFWPLAGAYLLIIALLAVVYTLGGLIIFALGAVLQGGNIVAAMMRPDYSSIGAYFTPFRFAQVFFTAILTALALPVVFTPPVAIFRALSPSGLAAADVFS